MKDVASFSRGRAKYKVIPTILILCEDSKSSISYINNAALHFRVTPKIEVFFCGYTDPLNIIKEAIKRKGKYDLVYCVIDRDHHEGFDEANQLASKHKQIIMINSFPCYEYWLLLHFRKSRKPYHATGKRSAAENLLQDLTTIPELKSYEKGGDLNVFNALLGQPFDQARKISPIILQQAIEEDCYNPSTKMHILIDALEELSTPKTA